MVRLVAVLFIVLLGCGGPTPPGDGNDPPPADGGTRLVAEATTVRLRLGEALTLPVSAVDEQGNQISLSGATFETNGRLVADVQDLGLVKALEPGSDTVVVRLDGDSVAIEILVEY